MFNIEMRNVYIAVYSDDPCNECIPFSNVFNTWTL